MCCRLAHQERRARGGSLVVFDSALAATIGYRRKRAGHLFSKMRFLSAQLDAYLPTISGYATPAMPTA